MRLKGKELTEDEVKEKKTIVLEKVKDILKEEMGIEIRTTTTKSGEEMPLLTLGFLGKDFDSEESDVDIDVGFGGLGWFPGILLQTFVTEYSKELLTLLLSEGKKKDIEEILEKMGVQIEEKNDHDHDIMYG